jgi:hypothetical protein
VYDRDVRTRQKRTSADGALPEGRPAVRCWARRRRSGTAESGLEDPLLGKLRVLAKHYADTEPDLHDQFRVGAPHDLKKVEKKRAHEG